MNFSKVFYLLVLIIIGFHTLQNLRTASFGDEAGRVCYLSDLRHIAFSSNFFIPH